MRVSYATAMAMFRTIHMGAFELTPTDATDRTRMLEIMETYGFDFVDCAIMAQAERLNITDIYTFDRRDFSVFVPRHAAHLRLLP